MNNPEDSSIKSAPVVGAGVSRRAVVKGAAWSVPVIAVATAAPLATASVTPPPATFWGTGATVAVESGNITRYQLWGENANGDDAALPVGSTVTFTPGPGVTLEIISSTPGVSVTDNGDGSYTFLIAIPNVTAVDIRFRPTGPSGGGYSITTSVPGVAPYLDTIAVVLN